MKTPFINARWKGKEEGGDGRVSRKKKRKKLGQMPSSPSMLSDNTL